MFLPIGQYDDELFLSRHVNAAAAMGRLRLNVGLAEARAEMDTIARSLRGRPRGEQGRWFQRAAQREDLVGNLRPTLVLLSFDGDVRAAHCVRQRQQPYPGAVHAPIGGVRRARRSRASRTRILRQTLTESVCLAFAGASSGARVMGYACGVERYPSALPDVVNIELNRGVLLVAAAAALLSGLACAVAPACATRPNVNQQLASRERVQAAAPSPHAACVCHPGGADSDPPRRRRSPDAQPGGVWRVDPGSDPHGVVMFMTGLPHECASDPEQFE